MRAKSQSGFWAALLTWRSFDAASPLPLETPEAEDSFPASTQKVATKNNNGVPDLAPGPQTPTKRGTPETHRSAHEVFRYYARNAKQLAQLIVDFMTKPLASMAFCGVFVFPENGNPLDQPLLASPNFRECRYYWGACRLFARLTNPSKIKSKCELAASHIEGRWALKVKQP